MSASRGGPVHYRIRVRGWIGSRWGDWLEGMTVTHTPGETVLAGPVIDQAALLGLLQKIHNMGLSLTEMRVEEGAPAEAPRAAEEEV